MNKQLGIGEFGIVQQGVWTNGSERVSFPFYNTLYYITHTQYTSGHLILNEIDK